MEGVRLRIRRTRPDDESELRDVVTSRREVVAGFRTLARDTAAHPGLIAHWFGLGAESAQADVRWAKACKSALAAGDAGLLDPGHAARLDRLRRAALDAKILKAAEDRSEEHTSELQSLMRISYAVFCLKKK